VDSEINDSNTVRKINARESKNDIVQKEKKIASKNSKYMLKNIQKTKRSSEREYQKNDQYYSSNNSDVFFSERSSVEPSLNLIEIEKDLNLKAFDNVKNNKNSNNRNKNYNNFNNQSIEISFKDQIKSMEEEEERKHNDENLIEQSDAESILFDEVISYKKIKTINIENNTLYKNKVSQSTISFNKEKILESLKNITDNNLNIISNTSNDDINNNNLNKAKTENFKSDSKTNIKKKRNKKNNKILVPNRFLVYEYDDYYHFIKSNSDFNSGSYIETNKVLNTNLWSTPNNYNNFNNNKQNFNNFEIKDEKGGNSPTIHILEKSINSEKNSELNFSHSSSLKVNGTHFPHIHGSNAHSSRTINSEFDSKRTKVLNDIKFDFNIYKQLSHMKINLNGEYSYINKKRPKSDDTANYFKKKLTKRSSRFYNNSLIDKNKINLDNIDCKKNKNMEYSIISINRNNLNDEISACNKNNTRKGNTLIKLKKKVIADTFFEEENSFKDKEIKKNGNSIDDSNKDSFSGNSLGYHRSKSNHDSSNIRINMKIDANDGNSQNKIYDDENFNFHNKFSDNSPPHHKKNNFTENVIFNIRNNNSGDNNIITNMSIDTSSNDEFSHNYNPIFQESIDGKKLKESAKNTLIHREDISNIKKKVFYNNTTINKVYNSNNSHIHNNNPQDEKSQIATRNQIINNISLINNNYNNNYKSYNKRTSKVEKMKKAERRYKKQILKFNILSKIDRSVCFSIIAEPEKNSDLKKNSPIEEILDVFTESIKNRLVVPQLEHERTLANNANNKIALSSITSNQKEINSCAIVQSQTENTLNINKKSNIDSEMRKKCNSPNNIKESLISKNSETIPPRKLSKEYNSAYTKFDNLLSDKDFKKDDDNSFVFLVIDDNLHLRNSIKNVLKITLKNLKLKHKIEKEFEILEGCDGIDALKFVIDSNINSRIKGIFIDENMEYMNGSEAIKIIRNFQNVNKINSFNIVTVTAFEDQVTRNNILKAGVDELLQKPLSKHHLEEYFKRFPIC